MEQADLATWVVISVFAGRSKPDREMQKQAIQN